LVAVGTPSLTAKGNEEEEEGISLRATAFLCYISNATEQPMYLY
jgi:hypothetical protein